MELSIILKNVFTIMFTVAMIYSIHRVYTVLSEMKEG
jgi:hypothetical protein